MKLTEVYSVPAADSSFVAAFEGDLLCEIAAGLTAEFPVGDDETSTEAVYDARLGSLAWMPTCPEWASTEFLTDDKTFECSFANGKTATEWWTGKLQPKTTKYSDLARAKHAPNWPDRKIFDEHVIGGKDGPIMCATVFSRENYRRPGEGAVRSNQRALFADVGILECDSGSSFIKAVAKARELCIAALFWTSPSHGQTQTTYAAKAVRSKRKQLARQGKVALDAVTPEDAVTALLQGKYIPDIVASAKITVNEDGSAVVDHDPVDRFRVMIFFDKRVDYGPAEVAGGVGDNISREKRVAIDTHTARVHYVANALGIDQFDTCSGRATQGMYLPRASEGAEDASIALISGRLTSPDKLPLAENVARPREHCRRDHGERDKEPSECPIIDRAWPVIRKHFDIAALLMDFDPNWRREDTDENGEIVAVSGECPFEELHSTPGGQPFRVWNAEVGHHDTAGGHCFHTSNCQSIGTKAFVAKMKAASSFTNEEFGRAYIADEAARAVWNRCCEDIAAEGMTDIAGEVSGLTRDSAYTARRAIYAALIVQKVPAGDCDRHIENIADRTKLRLLAIREEFKAYRRERGEQLAAEEDARAVERSHAVEAGVADYGAHHAFVVIGAGHMIAGRDAEYGWHLHDASTARRLAPNTAVYDAWLNNREDRTTFAGLAFAPCGVNEPHRDEVDGYLNLWRGWGVEGKPGDWGYCVRMFSKTCVRATPKTLRGLCAGLPT